MAEQSGQEIPSPAIVTPDRRVRVFISSTLEELAPERLAAREAIAQLRQSPVFFEAGARPYPPLTLYRAYLEQSDVFVGIYWQQYGWVAPDMDVSGIEDEYRVSQGKPRLIYIKTPAPERDSRLATLIDRIRTGGGLAYKRFATPDELRRLLVEDLATLLAERFAGAAVAPTFPVPHALPLPMSSFVGRKKAVADALARLRHPELRLLTFTGPGGVGKTRLALEAGSRLQDDFADGAAFVDLAPLSEAALVPSAILQALGVPEDKSGRLPVAVLKDHLAGKHLLLILDNFERLLDSAPVVVELLGRCPRLKILATSRSPLRVGGEQELPVDPMDLPNLKALPPLEKLAQNEAVDLFVRRASSELPNFALDAANANAVAEICVRLDGLPLAIELAAARIQFFRNAPALLAQLDPRLPFLERGRRDAPARQQTMRNTIRWSYDLLAPAEQILMRRLAIFPAGCTLEAAEVVAKATGTGGADVLDELEMLVEARLLRVDDEPIPGQRFSMLGTIREFGLEQLAAHAEVGETRRAIADYFVALAEQAEEELQGPRQADWLDRLEADLDNLRMALSCLIEETNAESALRLGSSLWRFWSYRGYRREARSWLEGALAVSQRSDSPARAKALYYLGNLAIDRGEYDSARASYQASLAIRRQLDDQRGVADALNALGVVASDQEDYDRARELLNESLAIRRGLGTRRDIAQSLYNLANLAREKGQLVEARSLYEESLAIWDELQDVDTSAYVNLALAVGLRCQGDIASAVRHAERSLALFQELNDAHGIGAARDELGRLASSSGDDERAAALFLEALSELAQGGTEPDTDHNWIEAVEGLAWIALARGQETDAARLLGAADAHRRARGLPFPSRLDRQKHERRLGEFRLGADPARTAAWESATSMSARQIIDLALSFAPEDRAAQRAPS